MRRNRETSQADDAELDADVDAIEEFTVAHGYPPRVRDFQRARGFSSTSVAVYHLVRLEATGRIRREPNTARGIVVVDRRSLAERITALLDAAFAASDAPDDLAALQVQKQALDAVRAWGPLRAAPMSPLKGER